ncbi:MAG: polysaccharide biosynthesis C-terminal domain-containing protein, partial [Sulfobacillus thermotolerans]|nr:polysaccharide biosynthesis C-terminal domain-containing protein [Sulfobacillus thermotolerans]
TGATRSLQLLAIGSAVLAIQQVLGSSLQASGHGWIPVKNLLIAAVIKFVLTWRLTGIPVLGIQGAAFGTVAASFGAAWLNWRDWRRLVGARQNPWMGALWPLVGTVVMAMGVQTWMRMGWTTGLIWPVATAVGIGVVIYFLLMAMVGELNVLKSLRE